MTSIGEEIIAPGYANGEPPGRPAESAAGGGGTELGFDDLLDVINPLQHIPFVSYVYRQATGDEIASPARIAGGLLFGGPIGFVASLFDSLFAESSGDSLVGHAVAALGGEEADAPARHLAEAAPADRRPAEASAGGHAAAAAQAADGGDGAPDGTGSSLLRPDTAELSPERFARRMMQALDKYELLVRARQAPRVDRTL